MEVKPRQKRIQAPWLEGTAAEPGDVLEKGHQSSCRKNMQTHTHTPDMVRVNHPTRIENFPLPFYELQSLKMCKFCK